MGIDGQNRVPAWRLRKRRRTRQLLVSFLIGAAIGALAHIATALTGHFVYAYVAVFGIGGIGLMFGLALIVGLNLGRLLMTKMESPSEAMPRQPFAGACLLVFAVSVIVVGAITGGLLAD